MSSRLPYEDGDPMRTPRTSIIMPVYNTANTVINAIQSVRNQTDPNFELLIMIDGSPDNSADIITDYHKKNPDTRIHIFNNPENKGLSAMRNQGLEHARGEWVVFPDSDVPSNLPFWNGYISRLSLPVQTW